MYDGDDWLAVDKLYHVVFGFVLVLLVSVPAMRSRYSFLRRYAIQLGCMASMLAGAAKEAADEIGIFRSAGASSKDAFADLIGVGIASLLLLICKRMSRSVVGQQSARSSSSASLYIYGVADAMLTNMIDPRFRLKWLALWLDRETCGENQCQI
ncbi:unnamed protein product [Rhodiola kirilowii]